MKTIDVVFFFCHQIILNIWVNLVKSKSFDEKQNVKCPGVQFCRKCLFCVVLFVRKNKDILVKVLSFNPHFCLFHQQHCMLMMSQLMFNDIVTISSPSRRMLHSCAPRNGLTSQVRKSFFWISVFAQSIKQHIKRCFWYLSDEEEQSCTLWSIFHKYAFYHQPNVYFRMPCFSVMWRQICNLCAKYFFLLVIAITWEGVPMNCSRQNMFFPH